MFASQPPAKKTVKVHPQGWLDAFTEQQVLCLEYQDLEPEVEREIFQVRCCPVYSTEIYSFPLESSERCSSSPAPLVLQRHSSFMTDPDERRSPTGC